jgi:hypothetical protein
MILFKIALAAFVFWALWHLAAQCQAEHQYLSEFVFRFLSFNAPWWVFLKGDEN